MNFRRPVFLSTSLLKKYQIFLAIYLQTLYDENSTDSVTFLQE